MIRDDIIRMAREAGWTEYSLLHAVEVQRLETFAALVAAAEQEKAARWMIRKGYATGHGDTTEDLLEELEWQIAERK